MKCPRCLAVAMESDTVCLGCKQPLVFDDKAKPKRTPMPLHAKLTIAFAGMGAVLGLMVGFAFFPGQPGKTGAGGSNWALSIGIGAGIGAIIGYTLGVLVFEKDEPKAAPRLQEVPSEVPSTEPTAQSG